MSGEHVLPMLRSLLSESLLLQRLFFASLELAGLALVVLLLVRIGRIRSPRLICWLWLVVLIKPIVSLAVGSPIAVGLLDRTEAQPAELAQVPALLPDSAPDARQYGWASVPWGVMGEQMPPETPASSVPTLPPHIATDDPGGTGPFVSASLSGVISLAWLAGAVFFLLRYLLSRIRLYRIVRAAAAPSALVRRRYREVASGVGLTWIPRLLVTDALDSPALVGLLRPMVLVPSWLARQADDPKLHWSLRHELLHWKWLDPAGVLLRDLAGILFYFHPAVWWAAKRQTEAMELACDRAMLRSDADAADYAEQLYQILKNIRHRRRLALAGGLFATRTQVGQRIAALLDGSLVSAPRLTVVSVIGVLALAAGALAVGGAVRPDATGETSEQSTQEDRVLRFPRGYTLGSVYVRQPRPLGSDWGEDWEYVGPARGTVRVPADKDVWLHIHDEGLANIGRSGIPTPGDIQLITFYRTPPDAAGRFVAKCGKLKWLAFYEGLPGEAGLASLSRLESLEALIVGHSELTDQQLRTLVDRLKGLQSLRWIELGSTQLTDAGLAHLRDLPSIERLCFGSHKMAGHGLAHLADLPRLEYLGFGSQSMGDTALEHLAGCTSLKHLAPNCPKITDAGMPHLAKLKSLEELDLRWVPITDAGLAHLSGLKSLRELNLEHTKVTDTGLAHLAGLTSLERLTLPSGTTDAGFVHLRDLKGIKYLNLGKTQSTGAGLQALGGMKLVETLHLPSGITDDDLAVIGGMTALRDLQIGSDVVTDAGLAHLKALKSLRSLVLRTPNATGSGFAHLRGLPIRRLGWLVGRLDESRLTHLAGLQELEVLHLRGGGLRDEDLASIGKLTRLKELRIRCSTISDGGVAQLANLTSLETFQGTFSMTDRGLGHLAKLKNLTSLQIVGDYTNSGLQQLQGLDRLGVLLLWTDSELSPAALQRLKRELPAIVDLRVLKMGRAKPRPKAGQPAPAFTVQTINGKRLRLKDYRGKIVLLYFWSTWCRPCVASTPALKKFYEELSQYDGFAMVSLSLDDEDRWVREHVEKHGLGWPQVRLGLGSEVAANYGVTAVPACFLIGPNGKVLYTGLSGAEIRTAVAGKLKRSGSRR